VKLDWAQLRFGVILCCYERFKRIEEYVPDKDLNPGETDAAQSGRANSLSWFAAFGAVIRPSSPCSFWRSALAMVFGAACRKLGSESRYKWLNYQLELGRAARWCW
jgi:hypothetical protein